MQVQKPAHLTHQIQRILGYVNPSDKTTLEQFLMNVIIFIKRARGDTLTGGEVAYPAHPKFAHYRPREGWEAAKTLQHHLDIIERYQISDAKRIIDIITTLPLVHSRTPLTKQMIRILLELYHNPLLPRYKLAERVGTTSNMLRKDISTLQHNLGLITLQYIDPHKFKLAHREIAFRTKSLKASDRLEQYFLQQRPKFLRWLAFDHDYRKGFMLYYVPNQPRGSRLFEERFKQLNDEYFQNAYALRKSGIYYSLSFDGYDSASGSWMLEADLISEAMMRFAKEHHETIPKLRGFSFSQPIHFDRIDYLIAQTAYALPSKGKMEFRRKLLRKRGFKQSAKRIWSREQNLRRKGVYFPIIYFKIPSFDEFVMMGIQCSLETQQIISTLPSMLPFAVLSPTDLGVNLTYQRPAYCAGITRQLIRTISNEVDKGRVDIVRTEFTHGTTMIPDVFNRWDTSRQRWVLQEGDI